MKKTIALLLALLLVAGAVFAEVIDITDQEDHSETHVYDMYLEAVVEEGGGLNDNNGGDPSDIKNGGLYIMVGYNNTSNTYTMGNPYADGSLVDLGSYTADFPLPVSLTPENAADTTGTLQFYVAAQSNTSKAYTTTVKFESEGFKKDGTGATVVDIDFSTGEEGTKGNYGLSSSTEGLTVTLGDNPQIKVTAAAGSHQQGYIYVARTDATWTKSSNYDAGTYEATIKVTVGTEA